MFENARLRWLKCLEKLIDVKRNYSMIIYICLYHYQRKTVTFWKKAYTGQVKLFHRDILNNNCNHFTTSSASFFDINHTIWQPWSSQYKNTWQIEIINCLISAAIYQPYSRTHLSTQTIVKRSVLLLRFWKTSLVSEKK